MEFISSDTNVWFDYYAISTLELPFRLDCTYIIFYETLREEIVDPPELISKLRNLGLLEVDLSDDEYYYASDLIQRYPKLSVYDAIALSVAKYRNILLLTGDNALRKVAQKEGVAFMGSIGLIDRLLNENRISQSEYLDCLNRWKNQSASSRRLPAEEIDKRIKRFIDKESEV